MKKNSIQVIASLLVLLFVYTAFSKLLDFSTFKDQMHNQAMKPWINELLIWLLPPVEIAAACLLLFERTRLRGFYLSAALMTGFTIYVLLVLLHVFHRVPCSCGGVLKVLGWRSHFVFNLFFMLLSFTGIYFTGRERRITANS
jgi:putative oxidoreductase